LRDEHHPRRHGAKHDGKAPTAFHRQTPLGARRAISELPAQAIRLSKRHRPSVTPEKELATLMLRCCCFPPRKSGEDGCEQREY